MQHARPRRAASTVQPIHQKGHCALSQYYALLVEGNTGSAVGRRSCLSVGQVFKQSVNSFS
eukprot:1126902-Amphidinium_carterae.2